jgi:MFS family permease
MPDTAVTEPDSAPLHAVTPAPWAVLLVLCGAVFLEGADVSMMGVALPSIRADLGLSTTTLQWVVSAYVLGYGGFVLLGGRASDLLGRRRMFVASTTVFLLFSGLGGLATEGWMLLVARFATGVAAGFMAPAGLSIITTTFAEGTARNKALLVYGGAAGGGFSFGLVGGGLLTAVNWRWVFFAPVVVSAILLALAVRFVPKAADTERRSGRFDLAGALTLSAAMLLFVTAVVRIPDVGAVVTLATLVSAAVALAVFAAVERRTAAPLVRLGILRSRALVRANVAAGLFVGAFTAFQFIAVLYLQELRGWSALETGLAMLVVAIDAVLAPTVTPRLVDRWGNTPVMVTGAGLAALGYAAFLGVGLDWPYAAMLPTFVLVGLAFSLAFGTFTIAATDGITEDEQGLAGGLNTASFQFGGALGVAAAAAVTAATTEGALVAGDMLDGYRTALLVPLVAAAAALVVAATGLRLRRRADPEPTVQLAALEQAA